MKPVWLLDVDGVLNASSPGWGQVPKSGTAFAEGYPYKIVWAPRLIDRIIKIHELDLVDIRWCTTWCDLIGTIETLMGLPVFPCEPVPTQGLTQQAKIDAAVRVVASNRPLIWTDDNAIPKRGQAGWDTRFNHPPAGHLFIEPNEHEGLQLIDMQDIQRFIDENS